MTTLSDHLDDLRERGDLLEIGDRVHWDTEAAVVATEALRHNCAALRFDETAGRVAYASGVYAGPDQISGRENRPWRRIAAGLGLGHDVGCVDLLDVLSRWETTPLSDAVLLDPAADRDAGDDLYALGLPGVDDAGRQGVTQGVIAVERDGTTTWAPVRGTVHRGSTLRVVVPGAVDEWFEGGRAASVSLGVEAATLVAALQGWTQDRTVPAVPERAAGLADVPLARVDGRVVPASAEVRIDGVADPTDAPVSGPEATWERATETATLSFEAEGIRLREDPTVPFVPLGAPLADDVHLMSLVEAATLYRRVNGYWGVSPVSWVQLPVESRLGLCLVSSEILYAGFDWQLANALFSFSDYFDKVLVLDEYARPTDLARALDDMWVKAHPGNDWVFSDPNAPAATAPVYRRDGETGSRLYISAIWDPRWDEDYIAPRVTFESSFPEGIRESALERWETLTASRAGDDGIEDPPPYDDAASRGDGA
ncbi:MULTISPECIES: UbiD family decarboxylase [Haloferacaceae]|uniref:UbiD family decarboxylase n=1 Tax=Halorubrum glutamatedens TaxID=2707018 RepID=A0ABD5QUZ7_9EURY|nr:UbiD family decarboxylase [Halobellus captivus]